MKSRRVAIPLADGSVAHATMNGPGPDSPETLGAIKKIVEAAQRKMAERIVGVAVLLPFRVNATDPRPIFAACPATARHHHILHQLHRIAPGLNSGLGFVTDTGRYVDRKEAWEIAKAAGQLLDRAPTDGRGGKLYSEDVW